MRLNTVDDVTIGLQQVDELACLATPHEAVTAVASAENLIRKSQRELDGNRYSIEKLTKSSPQKFASLIIVLALRWPRNFCTR